MGFVLKGDAETVFRLIRLMAEAEKTERAGGRTQEGENRRPEYVGTGSATSREASRRESGKIPAVFLEAFEGEG